MPVAAERAPSRSGQPDQTDCLRLPFAFAGFGSAGPAAAAAAWSAASFCNLSFFSRSVLAMRAATSDSAIWRAIDVVFSALSRLGTPCLKKELLVATAIDTPLPLAKSNERRRRGSQQMLLPRRGFVTATGCPLRSALCAVESHRYPQAFFGPTSRGRF